MGVQDVIEDVITWDPTGGRLGNLPGLHNPINTLAGKDKKVPLSTLGEKTGWGPKNSQLNQTMRGVVWGESRGNPKAGNFCCHGLMQMNVLVHAGKFGIPKEKGNAIKWLQDPTNNLKAAKQLYDEAGGWGPWDAHNSGSFQRGKGFDPLITDDISALSNEAVDEAKGELGVPEPLAAIADILSALAKADTWARFGKGGLGGIMVILGTGAMVFVIANKASGSTVGRATKTAAKKVT